LTLDYNHRPSFADQVNAAVDRRADRRSGDTPPRDYLGGIAPRPCLRARPAVRVHGDAEGRGPGLQRPVAAHLRHRPCARGSGRRLAARRGLRPLHPQGQPARWRPVRLFRRGRAHPGPCRRHHRRRARRLRSGRSRALGMQDHERQELARLRQGRRDEVQAGLCRPDRGLSGLHGSQRARHQRRARVFTAINKDTAELHHELVPFDADLAQRMSDRGVRILQATDAGELLPRIAASPTSSNAASARGPSAAGGCPA
jgi:hypothetical protein